MTGEAILGANIVRDLYVIGIDLDYETGGQGTMLMVSASGTAVRLGASPLHQHSLSKRTRYTE